jgi:anti-sigma B factor antagonist
MSFTCSIRRVGDVATVTPFGDIDLPATIEFRETLQGAARDEGIATVVVDLSGVSFIDSTALGVLVAARTASQRRGATFAVADPGPMVTMVLTVTGLFDVLVAPASTGPGQAAASSVAG